MRIGPTGRKRVAFLRGASTCPFNEVIWLKRGKVSTGSQFDAVDDDAAKLLQGHGFSPGARVETRVIRLSRRRAAFDLKGMESARK